MGSLFCHHELAAARYDTATVWIAAPEGFSTCFSAPAHTVPGSLSVLTGLLISIIAFICCFYCLIISLSVQEVNKPIFFSCTKKILRITRNKKTYIVPIPFGIIEHIGQEIILQKFQPFRFINSTEVAAQHGFDVVHFDSVGEWAFEFITRILHSFRFNMALIIFPRFNSGFN